MLVVKDVEYKYFTKEEDHVLFENVNVQFEKGKVYAIIGPSGTGKSTFLSLLAGIERPSSGSILLNNQNIDEIGLSTFRKNNIAMIFQNYNLISYLNSFENVNLSMEIMNTPIKYKKRKEMIGNLLDYLGIDEQKAKRKVRTLSGGEQQRVAIARALSKEVNIILADEPTGNLDIDNSKTIMNILLGLAKEENKCVIIVTHDLNIKNQSDVVLEIEDKKVLLST